MRPARIHLILLLLSPVSWILAQSNIGQLPIQNFERKTYKAQAQNWQITQGQDLRIYVANNGAILNYDGQSWNKLELEGENTVRSVLEHNDTIFFGSPGEFGFFSKNEIGKRHFTSLRNLLPDTLDFKDVWNINLIGEQLYFQTHKYLFKLNPSRDQINIINPGFDLNTSFQFGDRLYFYSPEKGLCQLEEDQILPLKTSISLEKTRVSALFMDGEDLLVFTMRKGVYTMRYNSEIRQHVLTPYNEELNAFLDGKEVFNAELLPNGLISIGTWGNGVFLVNQRGVVINQMNKTTGLVDDIIQCQFIDRQNNLWLGTSNGISKIEINSSVSVYNDLTGLKGTVEELTRFKDTLYAATHNGLFLLNESTNRFEKVESVLQEVWGVYVAKSTKDDHLLMALNDGIYELRDGTPMQVAKCYPWMFLQLPGETNRALCGLDDGLMELVFDTTSGKWKSNGLSERILGQVFKLQNVGSEVWLPTMKSGIFQTNGENWLEINAQYDTSNGLPVGSMVVDGYRDTIYFGTKKGLYKKHGDGIAKSNLLNRIGFPKSSSILIHRISNDDEGRLWMVTHNNGTGNFDIGYVEFVDEEPSWQNSAFSLVSEDLIHSMYHDKNSITWLGGVRGIFKYDHTRHENNAIEYPVYITNVRLKESEDSAVVTYDINLPTNNVFSFSSNSIWFNFAAPNYSGNRGNEYSFYLEGKEQTWSDWKKNTVVNYQNLNEGTYVFHVRARDFYGHESTQASYSFTILPPWYRSWWAYLLYFIAFIFILVSAIRLSIRRVKKQNEKLEEIIEERTAEIVSQKEEIELQKELVDARNKDILDSIKYAERIQTAILPPQSLIQSAFNDAFVLFRPKDIVSGDFYWMEVIDQNIYFAAVDCTGHGVPGAMVSVVGHNGLNQCVKEFGLTQPAEILDKLTKLVEATFSKGESQMRDGMDISLCKIDLKNRTVNYAGANNPAWIISKNVTIEANGESLHPVLSNDNSHLFEIKADKQPIGRYENRKPYTNHTVQLNAGDRIYLFSDGYADQFGGVKGKKFKYKPFKQLLLNTYSAPMNAQKQQIDERFMEWKKDFEQIDDVVVFGVEI